MPRTFVRRPSNWKWAADYLREVKKEMDADPENFDLQKKLDSRPNPTSFKMQCNGFNMVSIH